MAPPPRNSSGKGRRSGGRGTTQRLHLEHHINNEKNSNLNMKKHERSNNNKRTGGRGGGGGGSGGDTLYPISTTSATTTSTTLTRPTRTITTVLKKLLIRNIPSMATEEQVKEMLHTHGGSDEFLWRFVPGHKYSNNRVSKPARLYLDLKKEPEKARKLIAALDGQLFYPEIQDTKINGQPMDVDFAPFQKIPREKQRNDAKTGTIDRDPEYVAFLNELAKPKNKLPSAETLVDMAEGETVEKPVAALVKYLNEKKVNSREKSKGKFGGKPIVKNARRQKGKKAQKVTKDKSKLSKERNKKSSVDTVDLKSRKQRGKVSLQKEPTKQELAEPGILRIMTPKSAVAAGSSTFTPVAKWNGSALSADAISERGSEKRAPKSGKKIGSRGRSNHQKSIDGIDSVDGDGTNLKPSSRRKSGNSGKKEPSNKGERKKKKVFAPKDATAQGTPSKS